MEGILNNIKFQKISPSFSYVIDHIRNARLAILCCIRVMATFLVTKCLCLKPKRVLVDVWLGTWQIGYQI